MLEVLVDDLNDLKSDFTVFDYKYNKLMKDHPYYSSLKKKNYDQYRDLNQVWEDVICKEAGFNANNTLLIDSSNRKVQLCLDNSIVNRAYKMNDVQLIADKNGVIRGPEWHSEHMNRLANFVIKMADNCDDVRDWLKLNRPSEYEPVDLLSSAKLFIPLLPAEETKEEPV